MSLSELLRKSCKQTNTTQDYATMELRFKVSAFLYIAQRCKYLQTSCVFLILHDVMHCNEFYQHVRNTEFLIFVAL